MKRRLLGFAIVLLAGMVWILETIEGWRNPKAWPPRWKDLF